MTKPRCGKVDHISGFVSGDGQRLITIDGKTFAASINLERYPVKVGSIVEYCTSGNRAEILAVQIELLPRPQAQNLFSELDGMLQGLVAEKRSLSCTECIGTAGACECLKLCQNCGLDTGNVGEVLPGLCNLCALASGKAEASRLTKRTDEYSGTFPRKRHSHRCLACADRGQTRAVACHKNNCTRPQTTDQCRWCQPSRVTV